MANSIVYIGTAGWSIPSQLKSSFAETGTHLEKYATVFNCAEINSSFYKDHLRSSYERWAASTPDHFRFSVKLSRYFTQETGLSDSGIKLKETLAGIMELKHKLGVLLIQLPPSLVFNPDVVESFIAELRNLYSGAIVCEPRNRSWSEQDAVLLLSKYNVSRVIADPDPAPLLEEYVTQMQIQTYYRLHGSPKIYKSSYTEYALQKISDRIYQAQESGQSPWVIFDNTTYGFATENAIELKRLLNEKMKNLPVQFSDIGLAP